MKRLLHNDGTFPRCMTILHDLCSYHPQRYDFTPAWIQSCIYYKASVKFIFVRKKGNVDLSASPYFAMYILPHATHLLFRKQNIQGDLSMTNNKTFHKQQPLTFRIIDSPMGIGKSASLMDLIRFHNKGFDPEPLRQVCGNLPERNGKPGHSGRQTL